MSVPISRCIVWRRVNSALETGSVGIFCLVSATGAAQVGGSTCVSSLYIWLTSWVKPCEQTFRVVPSATLNSDSPVLWENFTEFRLISWLFRKVLSTERAFHSFLECYWERQFCSKYCSTICCVGGILWDAHHLWEFCVERTGLIRSYFLLFLASALFYSA